MKHIKLYEEFIAEATDYAVMLTGGSVGDKSRPRDARGYVGMDVDKNEVLLSLDKAKEKAKRMTANLSPGERKHYGLKYVVVPAKGGKFIKESESFVSESGMGDLHIMAQEASSFDKFKAEFIKEYGKPKSVKELKALEAWLQTIWNERNANEAFINEAFNANYWEDYHEDAPKITNPSSRQIQQEVEDAVEEWNDNNENGKENEVTSVGKFTVLTLAKEFVKAKGYICRDVIDAMIAQES